MTDKKKIKKKQTFRSNLIMWFHQAQ